MNKILILLNHYGVMDGVQTSMIDMYYNLRRYREVDFKIVIEGSIGEALKLFAKNKLNDLVKFFTIDKTFYHQTVVCSHCLFVKSDIDIKSDNIIVLDSFDSHKKFPPKGMLISNHANYGHRIYYHKFSKERLEKLKLENDLYYKRSDKKHIKDDNGYFENIGKSIFEHIWCGNKVFYHTDGMYCKDGLFHYLKLFGIDGRKNHKPLNITKEQIEKKLFMNEKDLILKLC